MSDEKLYRATDFPGCGHLGKDPSQPDLRDWIACMARPDDWRPYLDTGETVERVLTSANGRCEIIQARKDRTPAQARYAYADDMLKARIKP